MPEPGIFIKMKLCSRHKKYCNLKNILKYLLKTIFSSLFNMVSPYLLQPDVTRILYPILLGMLFL